MTKDQDRRPHAYGVDAAGRFEKAAKIQALIERRRPMQGARVLEVGCGSGWMAHRWAEEVGPAGRVVAVDRIDQRRTRQGFDFEQVEGTTLPFDSGSFDIVISNHVLEHVGDRAAQLHHLRELHRVLEADGVAYIAVPNKWRVVEPHFKLPFLSWLPQGLSDRYVKITGKGSWYDVVPPSHRSMQALLAEGGFSWDDVTLDSVTVMREAESMPLGQRLVARLPRPALRLGLPVVPSMIYVATPR